jgi:hypothetical protein
MLWFCSILGRPAAVTQSLQHDVTQKRTEICALTSQSNVSVTYLEHLFMYNKDTRNYDKKPSRDN